MITSTQSRERLDKILGLWDVLVDPKVGVVQSIEEGAVDDDDPEFFHYFSKACDTSRFSPMRNFSENGGVSSNRYFAIAKAMGEAVERYCAAIYSYDDLLFASHRDLPSNAVHPDRMTVYSDEQFKEEGFPWAPFTVDSLVHWTQGVSLVTGEEVWLPAASVYIPFHYYKALGSVPILQPISTGLACGSTFAEAAISGLCEAIERDAFTICWQARLSRPKLLLDSLPASGRDLVARFNAAGIDVELMDITTDIGVPTVLCFAITDVATSPAVAVAAATDASPERALTKSLEELAHTRKYSKQLMFYTPPVEVAEGHAAVKDQRDHLRFYCPQSSKPFAEFAWSSAETRSFASMPDLSSGDAAVDLQVLVQKVADAGLEAIACDLTTPDIRDLGLHVVRIAVPGAHPLCMGHQNRARGVRRLYEVPAKLGAGVLQPNQPDNPFPHPFP